MVVSTTSAGKSGYTTYQVGIQFGTDVHARDVYALYVSRLTAQRLRAQRWLMLLCLQGEEGDPLTIPPAFHVPAPFGTNIGPPNPLFYAVSALHRDHMCSVSS